MTFYKDKNLVNFANFCQTTVDIDVLHYNFMVLNY